MVDIDRDFKDERVMAVYGDNSGVNSGVITRMEYMDFQEGDINPEQKNPPVGFTNDLQMFTYVTPSGSTEGGTYLQIDEGKLFSGIGDSRQFVRNVQKKDSIDLIQRVFRLSNDTHRFCDASGVRVPEGDCNVYPFWCSPGLPNPVEACNDCFSPDNITKTCMDQEDKVIFVRSRVKDLHGRKWVTDVSGDDYVDFSTK